MDVDERARRVAAQSWDAGRELEQTIRNARPIPATIQQVRARPPIAVTAWLVWEHDGLQLLDTFATAWAGRDVLVEINDRRRAARGVWLAAQDVRRR